MWKEEIVIRINVLKDQNQLQITACSKRLEMITGLLAELNREINDKFKNMGVRQEIKNIITIKDSVLYKTGPLFVQSAD